MDWTTLLFSFNGRINRGKYWLALLIYLVGGSLLLSLAAGVIAIWAFIELGCLRGTPGANQYGPDPLGTPAFAPRR